MTLDVSQQAALEGPVARVGYFVEFKFLSGTQYACTANRTVTWGGHDWLGLGAIGGISAVEESDGIDAKSLSFTINAAQPEWLAMAVGSVEEYRGREINLYFCPLDESFVLVGTPQRCWRGIMDTVSVGIDGDEASIQLKAETSAYGLKRRPALRLNAAQQKQAYPTDTGFDYLTDLIANPQTWISIAFQRR